MGIDEYIYREKARAKRGVKVYGAIQGKKFNRTNIIAAKCGKEIIAPLEYKGNTNHQLVESWLVNMLLPLLIAGSVIILDNASFHRKKVIRELAERFGVTVIFLPPYSPDYNPIENYWAWLKLRLKKIMKDYRCFMDAFRACFQT
jgi:transposase